MFINVYTDLIDQTTPLLEARIEIRDGQAEAKFDYVDKQYSPFFSLYKRHCEALNLRERYAREGRQKLTSLHGAIVDGARKHGRGADWFLTEIRETAERDASALGINHWKPTLLRAASASRDFVEHCLQSAGIAAAPGAAGGGRG